MRITCPNCEHQFEVDPVMVVTRTFKVRCSKCQTRSEVDQKTGKIVGPAPGVPRGDTIEVRAPPPARRPPPGHTASQSRAARVDRGRASGPPRPPPTTDEVEQFVSRLEDAHRDMMGLDPAALFGVTPDVGSSALMTIYTELSEHWRPSKWMGRISEPEQRLVREIAKRLDDSFNDLSDLDRRRRAQSATPQTTTLPPRRSRTARVQSPPPVPRKEATEAEIFYSRGKEALNARRYAEAKEALEQCVALEPESAIYALKLGEATLRFAALEENANLEPAKKHFDRALELEPQNLDVLLGYGHFMKACGEVVKAMRYFKQVRDLEPKHHEANREIRLYLARKRKGASENTTTGKIMKMLNKKL